MYGQSVKSNVPGTKLARPFVGYDERMRPAFSKSIFPAPCERRARWRDTIGQLDIRFGDVADRVVGSE